VVGWPEALSPLPVSGCSEPAADPPWVAAAGAEDGVGAHGAHGCCGEGMVVRDGKVVRTPATSPMLVRSMSK
jgi:hypothetical protein